MSSVLVVSPGHTPISVQLKSGPDPLVGGGASGGHAGGDGGGGRDGGGGTDGGAAVRFGGRTQKATASGAACSVNLFSERCEF